MRLPCRKRIDVYFLAGAKSPFVYASFSFSVYLKESLREKCMEIVSVGVVSASATCT